MRRLTHRIVTFSLAAMLLAACGLLFSRPSPETPAPTALVGTPTPESLPTPLVIVLPTAIRPTQAVAATLQPLEPPLAALPSGGLIYAARGGMVRVQTDTQKYQRMLELPVGSSFPFVSSSGRRLGFIFPQVLADGVANLVGVLEEQQVYQPSGKSPARSLTAQPFQAAWSPDDRLVMLVNAQGTPGPSTSYYIQVFAFDPQASPLYWQVWSDFQVKGLVDIAWLPDSRGVVFITGEPGKAHFYVAQLSERWEPGAVQLFQEILPNENALRLQALPGGRMLYATEAGIYLQADPAADPQLVTDSLAPYAMAAFNASGRYAALYTQASGGPFILDLLTGSSRQVSDALPGSFSRLLWAPDGSYLAYTLANAQKAGQDDLYVTAPAGPVTFLRTIPSASPNAGSRSLLKWHPSQPYLTFMERSRDGYLAWAAAADGSGLAYLNPAYPAADPEFAWLADPPVLAVVELPLAPRLCKAPSTHLQAGNSAYSSLEPAFVSLLYKEAASTATVIGSLNPGEPAWVLGGPVCNQDVNFWLLRSKKTRLVGWAVEADASSYFLAPRSDALLFSMKKRIYALPLDTFDLRLVADPEAYAPGAGMQFLAPQWRADGEAVAYLATAPRMNAGLLVQAYPDGAVMDLLTTLNYPSYDLPAAAWSPDGSRLVVALGPEDGNRDLFLVQADGSLVQNLTGSPTLDDRSPVWSPDGKSILYLSGKDEQTELYITIPGESILRLTNNQVEEVSPAWSPLGTRIAFAEMHGNTPELYSMAANGSERARLTTQPGWYPAWSPDGRQIAFIDPVNDRLLIVNADASNLRVLALAGRGDSPAQVVWAPSGGTLAFVYQDTLHLYDLAAGSNTTLAVGLDNAWIAWQP